MNAAVRAIRSGVKETAAVLDQAQAASTKRPAYTYVPPSHARALEPDATLIEGIRGAGKSFWFALLASSPHLDFVRSSFPEVRLPAKIKVAQGFGTGLSISQAPDADTLVGLVEKFRPRSIWRAVAAHQAQIGGDFASLKTWKERVSWVQANPEGFAGALEEADGKLANQGKTLLILFDALDRMADDWDHIRTLAKGLLQVALDLRSTRSIRCKVYVRPDLLQDEAITSFPDYSKLLATKASLVWNRADLYSLLYQCLGNAETSHKSFIALASKVTGKPLSAPRGSDWAVPTILRRDESLQEELFKQIAGVAMGSSTKRGKPYTWLVNHLQDGLDQVSPRSFYAALGKAADETPDDYELPLDYRGIQRGVQEASQIRVKEITEDYPWVREVMAPLRGNLTVPCDASEITRLWKLDKTVSKLEGKLMGEGAVVKLPPQNIDQGPLGVLLDLEALGMVQRIAHGRVQMPDVYRVAFGFGRRGGVKPLR